MLPIKVGTQNLFAQPQIMKKIISVLVFLSLVFQLNPSLNAQTAPTQTTKIAATPASEARLIPIEELLPADTLLFAVTSNLGGLLESYRNLEAFKMLRQQKQRDGAQNPLAEVELFLSGGLKDSKVLDSARVAFVWLSPEVKPRNEQPNTLKDVRENRNDFKFPEPLSVILIETPKIELAQQAREEFIAFHTEYFGGLQSSDKKAANPTPSKIDKFVNGFAGTMIGTSYVVGMSAGVDRILKLNQTQTAERLSDDLQFGQARNQKAPNNGMFLFLNAKAVTLFQSEMASAFGSLASLGGANNLVQESIASFKGATMVSTFENGAVVDKINVQFEAGKRNYLGPLMTGPRIDFKSAEYIPAGTAVFFSHSMDWGGMWDEMIMPMVVGMTEMTQIYKDKPTSARENGQPPPAPDLNKIVESYAPEKLEKAKKDFTAKLEKELGFNPGEELKKDFGNEITIVYDMPKSAAELEAEKRAVEAEGQENGGVKAQFRFFSKSIGALIAIKEREATKEALLRAFAYAMSGFTGLSGKEEKENPTPKTDEQLKQAREQQLATVKAGYAMLPKEIYKNTEIVNVSFLSIGLNDEYLFLADKNDTIKTMIDAKASNQSLRSDPHYMQAMSSAAGSGLTRLYVAPSYADWVLNSMLKNYLPRLKGEAKETTEPEIPLQLNLPATIAANAEKDGSNLRIEAMSPLGIAGTFGLTFFGDAVRGRADENEDNARLKLRQLTHAQKSYAAKHQGRFASLEELTRVKTEGFDARKFAGEDQNYKFAFKLKARGYEATATPIKSGRNGRQSFFVDESRKLRAGEKEGASATIQDEIERDFEQEADDAKAAAQAEADALKAAAKAAADAASAPPPPPPAPKPRPRN